MPGIAGVIGRRAADECQSLVEQMARSMSHETFYVSGKFAEPALGLFAAWTALEKSFAASQPFLDSSGQAVLLLCGEVYREDNPARGLMERYKEEGEKFFENLNGLFSGLLIDRKKRQTFLFNDRFGFDRIYVVEKDDAIYFASEAKALLQVLPELREFNREGLVDLLAFGCTIENRTLFRGVNLLPSGSLWTFENGRCRKKTYFTPSIWEARPALPADEFQIAFDQTLARITPKYFESDFEVAVSLTAGLDTRMLMSNRPRGARPFQSYTYEGPTGQTVDTKLATEIANACHYPHHLLCLGSDFFRDFAAIADRAAYLTDGTLGPIGTHEIYLSKAAREIAPTRLTGVFGGEILRGVSTFGRLGLASELFDPELRSEIAKRGQELKPHNDRPVTFAAFKEIPWNIFGSVAACRSQLSFRTPFLDNDLVALAYQLPPQWRESSEPAARFIQRRDPNLASIPTDMAQLGGSASLIRFWRKVFAKATFKLDYWTNDGMPNWLAAIEPANDAMHWRPSGFGRHKYLRYRRWFRYELRDYIRDRLAARSIEDSGIFNARSLRTLGEDHISGRRNYVQEINFVLTIEAVQRLLLKTS